MNTPSGLSPDLGPRPFAAGDVQLGEHVSLNLLAPLRKDRTPRLGARSLRDRGILLGEALLVQSIRSTQDRDEPTGDDERACQEKATRPFSTEAPQAESA